MSFPTNNPEGWQPPTPPQQPAPQPAKKRRRWPWIVGALVGVFVVIGVAAGVSGTSGGQPGPANGGASTGIPAGDFSAPPEPTTVAPTFSASDFTVALKVTDKECFGSAGCDVTATPSVNYAGDLSDLDSVTLSITYEMTGDTSGTQVHTLNCDAGQCTGDDVVAQTASSSTKLKAHVTEVDVQ